MGGDSHANMSASIVATWRRSWSSVAMRSQGTVSTACTRSSMPRAGSAKRLSNRYGMGEMWWWPDRGHYS